MSGLGAAILSKLWNIFLTIKKKFNVKFCGIIFGDNLSEG
jgi:hypothetical protein